jgi:hypothetical protein
MIAPPYRLFWVRLGEIQALHVKRMMREWKSRGKRKERKEKSEESFLLQKNIVHPSRNPNKE